MLITGASRGVGRHLALDFAAAGARVAVNYVSSKGPADEVVAEIISNGGEAFAVGADIGSSRDVNAMFDSIAERWGGLDILVNNAGLNRDAPFLEMTEDEWDAVIATNLKGPFLCSQRAAKLMQDENIRTGRIINISAVTSLVGRGDAANYSASKGGVNALTRALAVELGPSITVNAIALGFFDSPLVQDLFSDAQIAEVAAKLPSGRLGAFDEISHLTQYLASDAAGFVTGQTISLDGGQIIRLP